jgi:hypothetical protein
MSEDVTILTSANHTSLVKTFSGPDLKEQSFVTGKDFNVSKEPVSNLQSLSKVLQRLETDPTHTLISSFQSSSNLLTAGIISHPAWGSRLVSGCIYGSGWNDHALMMK